MPQADDLDKAVLFFPATVFTVIFLCNPIDVFHPESMESPVFFAALQTGIFLKYRVSDAVQKLKFRLSFLTGQHQLQTPFPLF